MTDRLERDDTGTRSSTPGPRTTRELVRFALGTRYQDLPPEVAHATKRLILDTLAVTIGGLDTDVARSLMKLKVGQGGRADATLAVDGTRLPAGSVAYIHGQVANLLDADDTLLNSRGHYICSSVIGALTVGEMVGASGEDVIAAVAASYEISARVGLSLQMYVKDDEGSFVFAPLYGFSWMSFGVAVAASMLLGLDEDQTARAIGQAFVTTPVSYDIPTQNRPFYVHGMPANWHRYQASGASTEVGINAALLAQDGFIAQDDVLDEGSKFWVSFGFAGCDWDTMYSGLGDHWYVTDCSIKLYPFCRFGHSALDLFGRIVAENALTAADIESVTVRIPPFEQLRELAENVEVDEPLKLFVSLPSAMALMAQGIPAGPKWWQVDLTSSEIRDFAHRVHTVVDDAFSEVMSEQLNSNGSFLRIPTEVTVTTTAGDAIAAFAEYSIGTPQIPDYAMTDEQLAEKVRRFAGDYLPDSVEELIAACMHLEQYADLKALASATVA